MSNILLAHWQETSGQLQCILDAHLQSVPDPSRVDEPTQPVPWTTLTVLRAPGKVLAKRRWADGTSRRADMPLMFKVERIPIHSAEELFATLSWLENCRDRCVIRGVPSQWCPTDRLVRRLKSRPLVYVDDQGNDYSPKQVKKYGWQHRIGVDLYTFQLLEMFVEEPTHVLLLDIEKIDYEPDWRDRLQETADWLKTKLPDEFADASCWFQATASAADPSRTDLGGSQVRMRLAFLLREPVTRNQLKQWFDGVEGVDQSTFDPLQITYTARVVFQDCRDPMPRRSGVLEALEDAVDVPDELPACRSHRPMPERGVAVMLIRRTPAPSLRAALNVTSAAAER
jgi:hypothetical protein